MILSRSKSHAGLLLLQRGETPLGAYVFLSKRDLRAKRTIWTIPVECCADRMFPARLRDPRVLVKQISIALAFDSVAFDDQADGSNVGCKWTGTTYASS